MLFPYWNIFGALPMLFFFFFFLVALLQLDSLTLTAVDDSKLSVIMCYNHLANRDAS